MPSIRDAWATLYDLVQRAPGRVGLLAKDLASDEELSWEADEVFPAASLIKLPILVEVLRRVDTGELVLDDVVPIRPEDKVGGTGILKELGSVSALSVQDLITLMIVLSDNTASNLCIDKVSMKAVNETATSLGLLHTRLNRKMMDFEARRAGRENWTSARDMARLLELLATKRILSRTSCELAVDILSRQQLRDRLPRYLPAEVRVAHKTGELPGLRHDAGILFLNRGPVVIAVLTAEFATPASQGLVGGEGSELIAAIGRLIYDTLA